MLKGPTIQRKETDYNYLSELKMGFGYIKKGAIAHFLILFMILSIFGSMAAVSMPMFAEVHAGAASGYILLTLMSMLGSIIGSYIVSIAGSKFKLSTNIILGLIFAGLFRLLFVYLVGFNLIVSLAVYPFYVGMAGAVSLAIYSFNQKWLPKEMLGKVNTLITSVSYIVAVLASFFGGIVGNMVHSIEMVLIIHGVSYIAVALCMCLFKCIRELPKISDVKPLD